MQPQQQMSSPVLNEAQPVEFKALCAFVWLNIDRENFPYTMGEIAAHLHHAIEEKLAYFCNDYTGKLSTVIFGYERPGKEAFVWMLVGRVADLPYIWRQFRQARPDILKISGWRFKHKVTFNVSYLDRKFKYYGR